MGSRAVWRGKKASAPSDTTDSHSDIGLPLQQNTQPTGTALISLRHAISNKINRLLKKHNIRKIYIPQCIPLRCWGLSRKDLELKAPGVYRIPCECGKVHFGEGIGALKAGHEPEKFSSGRRQHQHGSLHWFWWHLDITLNIRTHGWPCKGSNGNKPGQE